MKESCLDFLPDDYAQCYMSSTNHCYHHTKSHINGDIECNLHGKIKYREKCIDFLEDYGCIER